MSGLLPMWNDDSSPYRSQPLAIRRQMEPFGISRRLPARRPMLTVAQQLRQGRNADMRTLRAQGWYLKEIAHRYKVHTTTVGRVCRGVKRNP